jgi:hypothetical protein
MRIRQSKAHAMEKTTSKKVIINQQHSRYRPLFTLIKPIHALTY